MALIYHQKLPSPAVRIKDLSQRSPWIESQAFFPSEVSKESKCELGCFEKRITLSQWTDIYELTGHQYKLHNRYSFFKNEKLSLSENIPKETWVIWVSSNRELEFRGYIFKSQFEENTVNLCTYKFHCLLKPPMNENIQEKKDISAEHV